VRANGARRFALDPPAESTNLVNAMAAPMMNEVLPDLLEEIVYLLKQQGADPLEAKLRALRIESVCDCGDENCASFATAAEVKVANYVELQSMEGQVIIDLNANDEICFIEVLGRPDVKYLLEEYYDTQS
jgi:hypothetical protein